MRAEPQSEPQPNPPPTVERGGEDGSSRQLSDQTKTGGEGRPGQPANRKQAQAMPQEQQVAVPETDPRSHL